MLSRRIYLLLLPSLLFLPSCLLQIASAPKFDDARFHFLQIPASESGRRQPNFRLLLFLLLLRLHDDDQRRGGPSDAISASHHHRHALPSSDHHDDHETINDKRRSN